MGEPEGQSEPLESVFGLTLVEGLAILASSFEVRPTDIGVAILELHPIAIGPYIDDERTLFDIIVERPGVAKCILHYDGMGIQIYLAKENGELRAYVDHPEPPRAPSIYPRPHGGTPSSGKYTPLQRDDENSWCQPFYQPTSPPPGTNIH